MKGMLLKCCHDWSPKPTVMMRACAGGDRLLWALQMWRCGQHIWLHRCAVCEELDQHQAQRDQEQPGFKFQEKGVSGKVISGGDLSGGDSSVMAICLVACQGPGVPVGCGSRGPLTSTCSQRHFVILA